MKQGAAKLRPRQSDAGAPQDTTKSRLLDTAASLFRQKGYAATTTRELAGALGIQNASLYHHIGGKEELLYALCVESMAHLHRAVEQAAIQEGDVERRLRAMIMAHAIASLEDRDKFATMMADFRVLSGDRREAVLATRQAFVEMIRSVLREAQEAGVVRDDIEPRHLALAWFNLINWSIFWYTPEGELSPAEIGEMMATVFFDGTAAGHHGAGREPKPRRQGNPRTNRK